MASLSQTAHGEKYPFFVYCSIFGRERQNLDPLAFFQILQAKFHSVLELNGITIGRGIRRQLAERCCFVAAETVDLLKRWRDTVEHEFRAVGNADCTLFGLGGDDLF